MPHGPGAPPPAARTSDANYHQTRAVRASAVDDYLDPAVCTCTRYDSPFINEEIFCFLRSIKLKKLFGGRGSVTDRERPHFPVLTSLAASYCFKECT
ncbi:hypothetical protein EVAR_4961_1 [Eumeta japonica]|uniref:Uncharacterized protein n=1 Tax=Eumeta variegata TaxID=151549 RepID=A0A4C1UZ41_EUMVA|nr:hypothetical protein EVAR_4961_1 [Eumeta japonica]